MKRYLLFIFLLIASVCFADVRTDQPGLRVQTENNATGGRPRTLKVTNGALTDNGDGTFSLTTSSGSGSVNTGIMGYFGYYPSTGTTIDDQAVLYTDTTNIGVGLSSPTAKLMVKGTGTTTGTYSFKVLDSSDNVKFSINDAGNVGVGVGGGGPDDQMQINVATNSGLHIYGGAVNGGPHIILSSSAAGGKDWYIISTGSSQDGGAGALSFYEGGTNVEHLFMPSGNVGINNSSPGSRLSVNGNSAIGSTFYSKAAPTNGLIVEGNVGIGSTVPQNALDVNGTAQMTGFKLTASPTNGYILTSNSAGVGTWQAAPAGGVTSVTGTTPIASSGGATPDISIANAVADGSTKGAASFTAADFNSSSGNISLDYVNGQVATTSVNGFLSSTDWNTFNGYATAAAGWTDGGTNVYITTNSDNVGIGTTTFATAAKLTIAGNGTTTGINTQIRDSSGAAKVTILDNGNIGIGTTVPQASLSIGSTGQGQINSSGVATFTTINNSGTYSQSGSSTNSFTGNVGIGTSAPSKMIEVWDNTATTIAAYKVKNTNTQGAASLQVHNNNGDFFQFASFGTAQAGTVFGIAAAGRGILQWSGATDLYIGTSAAGNVTFLANSAKVITILSAGNVGIGTTVPQAKFVVQGTGITTAKALQVQNSSAAVKLTVQDDGNVGIGTTAPEGNLIVRLGTNDIGWSVVTGANTACNTTCLSGCVFGEDTAIVGTIVGCADASADVCVCAGSN